MAKKDIWFKDFVRDLRLEAKKYGICTQFTGRESLEELADKFLSPEWLLFAVSNPFPTIDHFRRFKPLKMSKWGIYIDAGQITLENPNMAVLVGNTSAKIECTGTTRHEIVTLRGARASIAARDYSVVFARQDPTSQNIKRQYDNAVFLC